MCPMFHQQVGGAEPSEIPLTFRVEQDHATLVSHSGWIQQNYLGPTLTVLPCPQN